MERALLRSLSATALGLAFCACESDLPQVATPTVTAVFDPTAAKIPLPNDLVFASPINRVCPPPANHATAPTDPPMCAQAELLGTLNPTGAPLGGSFPSDQEVPLTIDFTESIHVNGRVKPIAPDLDLSTITPATLFVIGPAGPIMLEPPTPGDYVVPVVAGVPADTGTLTVHRQGHQPWPTGAYVLVMRGGDLGVKTKATADAPAIPVMPSPVFDLVEHGKDMTDPANVGLLKAQNNSSTEDALAQGMQLNLLIATYKNSVFPAADAVFPHEQMAIASTFRIGPTVTSVTVDLARGLAPLPFDILRDATTGKITPVAACSLAGGTLGSDGTCSSPGAAGFTTLDGFSTTAAILASTSDLVDVNSVRQANAVKLFDLSDPKDPKPVDVSSLIVEPCEFTSELDGTTCVASATPLAPVIAIQPASATSGDVTSAFRTRPLKDNTDYAVVLTTDIKDRAGHPIGPGTVAQILRFTNPLLVAGHSALRGIDDGTAASLEKMRRQLAEMFTALGSSAPANVAMAYTFHTQTVFGPAVELAALPYSQPAVTALPKHNLTVETPAAAFTRFGVPAGVPSDKIDEILEVDITTFNALDPATGAFLADPTRAVEESIHVLIATPRAAAAPACQGALAQFGRCAPLMVFRHGLTRGRADMLLTANSFAAVGMVTVAIDDAKQGDRTLCSSGAPAGQSGCVHTCTALPMTAGQGDPTLPGPPGTCDALGLVKRGLDGAIVTSPDKDGIPVASGNYLVSANFFRTRDTLRQGLTDQSQLIRVMAFAPDPAEPPPNTGHVVFEHMVQRGVIIDPATVYLTGQSSGGSQSTLNAATNPRISKVGLSGGGSTIVDSFTNSSAFAPQIDALLAGLGIARGTSQFVQFLTISKTILDPAEPINFAGHLTAGMLPNLLTPFGGNPDGTVAQLPKQVLIQLGNCDRVVPNPFGLLWSSNIASANPASPMGPLPNDPATFFAKDSTGAFTSRGTFQLFAGRSFNPADFGNPLKCTDDTAAGALLAGRPATPSGGHDFLLTFEHPDLTAAAQADLASFMMTGNPVPSVTLAAP